MKSPGLLLELGIAGFTSLFLWHWLRQRYRRGNPQGLPHPPGPKGLPLIGNVLDMPKESEWKVIAEWGKQYGDLIYVENFGSPLLFTNSYQVTADLLDKRSNIYSDRPSFRMLNEIMGWGWLLIFMPYSERFHKHRAFLNRFLHVNAVKDYQELQLRETHRFLEMILDTPQNFQHHLRRLAAAVIMMLAYGHEVAPEGDHFVDLADNAMLTIALAGNPGSYLVDFVPWLKYVPEWFPGAGWRRQGRQWAKLSHDMLMLPFNLTKERIKRGEVPPSIMSQLLESNTDEAGNVHDEDIIASASAVAYAGGAETTASSLAIFIFAMVLFPEAQKRAQEELDRVIGRGRLPTFEDRSSLPYVEAVVREAMRFHQILPLCPAHRLMEDDEYNGYFIPAGTTVVSNVWGILHDEKDYPDPFNFVPERWLKREGYTPPRDPSKAIFGFGRRICAGRHMGKNSLWIGVASILAAFNISKTRDKDGNDITPPVRFRSGLLSQPEPYDCVITPRLKETPGLIRQAAAGA